MKRILLISIILCLSAHGQILPGILNAQPSSSVPITVGSAGTTCNAASGTSLTCSTTPPTGNAVTIFIELTTIGWLNCTDSNGVRLKATSGLLRDTISNGLHVLYECYYEHAGAGVTGYTITYQASGKITATIQDYAAPVSINPFLMPVSGVVTTGTGTAASLSTVIEDANDWLVGGFGDTTQNITASNGSQRQVSNTQSLSQLLMDNTAVSGTVTLNAAIASSSVYMGLALELRTALSTLPGGWVIRQITPAQRTFCTVGAVTCQYQIPSVQAGSFVMIADMSVIDITQPAQHTISSVYLCPTSTCNSGTTLDTVTLPTNSGSFGCNGYATNATTHTMDVNCGYVSSAVGGEQFVSTTLSGLNGSERQMPLVIEIYNQAGMAVDDIEFQNDNGNSTTHTMTGCSTTGTDLIIQVVSGPNGPTTVTSPYDTYLYYDLHFQYSIGITSSGVAPTWTNTESANQTGFCFAVKHA